MRLVVATLSIIIFSACTVLGLQRTAALERGATGAGLATAICLAAGGSAATCAGAAAGAGLLKPPANLDDVPAPTTDETLSNGPLGLPEDDPFTFRRRGLQPRSTEGGGKDNDFPDAAPKHATAKEGVASTKNFMGRAVSEVDNYKVVLGADASIKMAGPPGELRIWIGNPSVDPDLPGYMAQAEGTLPKVGQTAKVTPFAPAFEIDPPESICIGIHPTGSGVRFRLKPTKTGIFRVGADVMLFDSVDCSGTPVPKATESLQVEVIVDSKEAFLDRAKQLSDVFWEKVLEFWGLTSALFFALLLFLLKRRLKKWFSFEEDK